MLLTILSLIIVSNVWGLGLDNEKAVEGNLTRSKKALSVFTVGMLLYWAVHLLFLKSILKLREMQTIRLNKIAFL